MLYLDEVTRLSERLREGDCLLCKAQFMHEGHLQISQIFGCGLVDR